MRKFVMGDVHGAYKALLQCLDKSGFDYEADRLVQLGDVVDGIPEVYECVEELMKIKHLIPIKGNHDDWFIEFINSDFHPYYWTYGGKGTLASYLSHVGKDGGYFAKGPGYKTALVSADIPKEHREFFLGQLPYYIDEQQNCFVHAGFDRSLPFDGQAIENFYWDRSLWADSVSFSNQSDTEFTTVTRFREIYIGHTPTTKLNSDIPLTMSNITNLDTGSGSNGRLTIMDIDTKQFWQSDLVSELYDGYSLD